jgi:hypothetical protein
MMDSYRFDVLMAHCALNDLFLSILGMIIVGAVYDVVSTESG